MTKEPKDYVTLTKEILDLEDEVKVLENKIVLFAGNDILDDADLKEAVILQEWFEDYFSRNSRSVESLRQMPALALSVDVDMEELKGASGQHTLEFDLVNYEKGEHHFYCYSQKSFVLYHCKISSVLYFELALLRGKYESLERKCSLIKRLLQGISNNDKLQSVGKETGNDGSGLGEWLMVFLMCAGIAGILWFFITGCFNMLISGIFGF